MKPLVAIIGPTAVGKSRLALHLARLFDGEIVGADSRQVYRHMDIGTAKPPAEELSLVPHHLINVVNPDEDFSLAQYQSLTGKVIRDIQRRNKLALLVGGSGMYIWSVLEGWGIPEVPPDHEFRRSLEERAGELGGGELHKDLAKIDPLAAQRIDPRNVRRTIRALEVHKATRMPPSRFQRRKEPAYNAIIIGLTAERADLYTWIDRRVNEMVAKGLVNEVKRLVQMGYDFSLPAMSGIGYEEIGMHIRGELALATAVQQIKFETHRFVRHQYSWFRLLDDRIKWYDVQNGDGSEITALIEEFVKRG
ncbi:tRNA (adenosine(37)-N6)-dimethylallyltransferase MiaA [Chloroflexota bacterium]